VQQFQNATAYALFGGVPHEVHGPILDKYIQLGGPTSFLGFPTSSQAACPDGKGTFNHFTGGSIYYHPLVGAFQIGGLIEVEWNSLGGPQYGYPNTDESGCADNIGRYNHFTSLLPDGSTAQASIYWTQPTGAHEVRGAIHTAWAGMGYETSWLGYPLSDEYNFGNGDRRSDFQNGSVVWNSILGNHFWPQVFFFGAPDITFATGVALGGSAALSLFSDGTFHFNGHLHDSGYVGYNILAVFAVKDTEGRAYTVSQTGITDGSIDNISTPSQRDLDWDLWGSSDDVRNNWPSIRSGGVGGGQVSVNVAFSLKQVWEMVSYVIGAIGGILTLAFTGGGSPKRSDGSDDLAYQPSNLPPGYSSNSPDSVG
jgi:hypothetical protein